MFDFFKTLVFNTMDNFKIYLKHIALVVCCALVVAALLLLLGLLLICAGKLIGYVASCITISGRFFRDLVIIYCNNTGRASFQYKSIIGLLIVGFFIYYFRDEIKELKDKYL